MAIYYLLIYYLFVYLYVYLYVFTTKVSVFFIANEFYVIFLYPIILSLLTLVLCRHTYF